jgi:transposase, IS5 family
VIDIFPKDREEEEGNMTEVTVSYSDDVDVAWQRKGNRAYYGYTIHVATDSRGGF